MILTTKIDKSPYRGRGDTSSHTLPPLGRFAPSHYFVLKIFSVFFLKSEITPPPPHFWRPVYATGRVESIRHIFPKLTKVCASPVLKKSLSVGRGGGGGTFTLWGRGNFRLHDRSTQPIPYCKVKCLPSNALYGVYLVEKHGAAWAWCQPFMNDWNKRITKKLIRKLISL